jgi:hypothetical protein
MKNDRFLKGILIGIGAIVILAVLIVILNQHGLSYLPEDTPEGVVNNYLVAWQTEDYEKVAYYLVDKEDKPDVETVLRNAYEAGAAIERNSVRIEKTDIRENSATVVITIIQQPNNIFSGTQQNNGIVSLLKQNGKWKISEFPYPYWSWNWYEAKADIVK